MVGIVDVNSFYCSCERVFSPSANKRPVMVLSNNDGCVIARTPEVKALGIKMGVPYYQIKEFAKQHNVAVFSSNYTLYGDMSNRVMTILHQFSPNIEVYSIDEAFVDYTGFNYYDLKSHNEELVKTILQYTGLPVSVGIAPTKTLAKIANKFAKKYPAYNGACLIDSESKRTKALKMTDIKDVWGIGYRYARKLKTKGVETALDFSQLPQKQVRKEMTVVGERTWLELNGQPCIEMELQAPDKKGICTSRAFGEYIEDLPTMKEAIATYAAICAEKARKQQSVVCSLLVFIHTNDFNEKHKQYYKSILVKLPTPSDSTIIITQTALVALEKIYKDGFKYKKAGVILTELCPADSVQQNLFVKHDIYKHRKLMKIMDDVNSGFRQNIVVLGVQGLSPTWRLKNEHLSGCYTTDPKEALRIKAVN